MYYIFEQKFSDNFQLNQYIFEAIDKYTKNTGNCIDSLTVIDYLSVLKRYIETKCPKKEKTFLRLVSFVKSSLDTNDSGVTTTDLVFADLMSEDPDNYLATHYILVKHRLDDNVIFDTLLFLKYNLLSTMNEETDSKNSQEIKRKYKKEMDLLNDGIAEAERITDDYDEDEEETEEMPQDFHDKLLKFLDEYKPYKIKEYLDKYIIGQEEAKKIMSTSIYNHIVMIAHPELPLRKNNVLMVGPSGCGKTEIMRVLSKILPVPISFFDSSGVSQSGWKGDKKVKDSVKELVLKSDDIAEAEHGIIFLDEFDKMCRPAFSSNGENVSVHIQGEILAMIEGSSVEVSLMGEDIAGMNEIIETKKILFICAGAFDGIEDIIKKERNKETSIGFSSKLKDSNIEISAKDITKEMIIKFGVTPELAGRLTITTALNKLTRENMLDILTKCEDNVIDELEHIMREGYNCEVEWKPEALNKLIDSLCKDVGARGLRSIVYEYFNDILFDLSSKTDVEKVIIDGELQAKYIYKKSTSKTKKKKIESNNITNTK